MCVCVVWLKPFLTRDGLVCVRVSPWGGGSRGAMASGMEQATLELEHLSRVLCGVDSVIVLRLMTHVRNLDPMCSGREAVKNELLRMLLSEDRAAQADGVSQLDLVGSPPGLQPGDKGQPQNPEGLSDSSASFTRPAISAGAAAAGRRLFVQHFVKPEPEGLLSPRDRRDCPAWVEEIRPEEEPYPALVAVKTSVGGGAVEELYPAVVAVKPVLGAVAACSSLSSSIWVPQLRMRAAAILVARRSCLPSSTKAATSQVPLG